MKRRVPLPPALLALLKDCSGESVITSRKILICIFCVSLVFSSIEPTFAIEAGMESGTRMTSLHLISPAISPDGNLEPNTALPASNDLNPAPLDIPDLPVIELKTKEADATTRRVEAQTPIKSGLSAKTVAGIAKTIKILNQKFSLKRNGGENPETPKMLGRFFDSIQSPQEKRQHEIDRALKRLSRARKYIRSKSKRKQLKGVDALLAAAQILRPNDHAEIIDSFQSVFKYSYHETKLAAIEALPRLAQISGYEERVIALFKSALSGEDWVVSITGVKNFPRFTLILSEKN